jgi:hypothetical protein
LWTLFCFSFSSTPLIYFFFPNFFGINFNI